MDEPEDIETPEVAASSSRRGLFRFGAGLGAAALGGAAVTKGALEAWPWLAWPGARTRDEIGRWTHRRHRPVAAEVRWCVDTERRALALSFDDGPDPEITPEVLEALSRHGAGATFFIVGSLAERHPELVAEIARRGHEVGNHSWSHDRFVEMDTERTEHEIGSTQELLSELTGTPPRWFRPPRGQVTGVSIGLAARYDMDVALWSQRFGIEEPGDTPGVGQLCDAVVPGDVVLLHDGLAETADNPSSSAAQERRARRRADAGALDDLLGRLVSDGWELVTLSELTASSRS